MIPKEFVASQRILIEGLPCLRVRPKTGQAPYPTLIYYHGWRSFKEYKLFDAAVFASYGYQVIVPDAIYHGERNPINYDAPRALEEYFWRIIYQSVDEASRLLPGLVQDHQADPGRIGLAGSSMGGFTAAGIFPRHLQLKCLVVFNGSCAWVKAEEIFRQISGRPPAGPEEIADLSGYDPLPRLAAQPARPILMLHGDSDTQVPVDSQRYFYEKISPRYRDCPQDLKLAEVPKLNHAITNHMLAGAVDWFQRYL